MLFVALVIRADVARAVLALAHDSAKRLNIFLIPLMVWPFFLLYRVQISDLKSCLRRISEGSLVKWLGFFSCWRLRACYGKLLFRTLELD